MRTRYLVLIFVALSVFMTGCSLSMPWIQQENEDYFVEPNIILIQSALIEVFDEMESYLTADIPVSLVTSADVTPEQRYLEQRYQEYSKTGLRQLFLLSDQNNENDLNSVKPSYTVALQARKLTVTYKKNGEDQPDKKLSRIIEVQIFCNVVERMTGEVLLAQTISKTMTDIVAKNDIITIQDSALPFTIGLSPKSGRMQEFLEIGSVVSTAGLILFLLFSTRS